MKKLTAISDWARDPLFTEQVRISIDGFIKDPAFATIHFVPVSSSSIHIAYVLAHLVEIEERNGSPLESVIYLGSAEKTPAEFIILRLISGMYICGINNQYNFSLIKHKIEEVYKYDMDSSQSSHENQWRMCAHLLESMQDDLDLEEMASSIIPDLRGHYIGYIDNYGNIKTTMRHDFFKGRYELGDTISLRIGMQTHQMIYRDHIMQDDEFSLVPSEDTFLDNPFMNIVNHNGRTPEELFHYPKPGMTIEMV